MSSLLVTSPPHLALTSRLFWVDGSDGTLDHEPRKFPVELEFVVPMRVQVLPLLMEYSSVIGVSPVVSMGWVVTALVSVPVMFSLPAVLATVDGFRFTVASVGVG